MTPALLLFLVVLEDAPAPGPAAGRVERAAALLGPGRREESLGPWRLLTDVSDRPLLDQLGRVAALLPEAYRARFGLDADSRPGETIVLFAREASYRSFTSDAADSLPLATSGHAGGGLAAALAGEGSAETRPIVVHELAHLLTQRVFALPAPAWIDEGLSEDLAWCRADAKGRLVFGTFDGRATALRAGDRVIHTAMGPRVTVEKFQERARSRRLPTLSALIAPGSRLSADAGSRRDAYTAAGLFVRFLLADDAARAERFRVFLRAAALGAPAGFDDLAAALDTDARTLERDYWTFVRGL